MSSVSKTTGRSPSSLQRPAHLWTIEIAMGRPDSEQQDIFTNWYPTREAAQRFIFGLAPGPGAPLWVKVWHRGECVLEHTPVRGFRPKVPAGRPSAPFGQFMAPEARKRLPIVTTLTLEQLGL